MRKLFYEYSPMMGVDEDDDDQTLSSSSSSSASDAVIRRVSSVWLSLRTKATAAAPLAGEAAAAAMAEEAAADIPSITTPAAAAAEAAAATPAEAPSSAGPKLVYSPRAYKSVSSFVIKPDEWFLIIFTGFDANGYRPDVIYNLKPAWPRLAFELHDHHLTLLVQNLSSETYICVHKGTRLHHLLRMRHVDACFTLVPEKERQEAMEVTSDNDDDDDDDDEIAPPPLLWSIETLLWRGGGRQNTEWM